MFPLFVEKFIELFSGDQMATYVTLSILNAVALLFCSMKFILVMQQCSYRGKRYFKWLSHKDTPYMSRLMLLCMLAFLFFCVLNMTFISMLGETFASYIGFCAYILFIIMYINSEKNINAKVPLKKTRRLIRLCITYTILLFLLTFGTLTLLNYLAFVIDNKVFALLRLSIICLLPLLIPVVLFLAYAINEPLEYLIRRYYIRRAEQILNKSSVIKIGITGSFAKTSVKEILKTILSQKYRVLATPNSFNTPLGIARTVTKLDSTHDVFIAEMGARQKGDIKELAKLVKPSIGVLTGVNNQHLESFGSAENIVSTKFELFENLAPNGIGVFASDNENSVKLFERFYGEKYLAGLNGNVLVTAKNIKTDERGTTFTLDIDGEKDIKCSTVLLGSHSVKNICLAATVAYKIGLTPKEIVAGISRIQSIGHRLELVPNNKNIVIIDDSYNANEEGIKSAMEVLDSFKGRKIVLTPGLVELGKIENLVNYEFGKTLAIHADFVIVVGKHNAEMIIKGLLEGGMPKENIKFEKTLNKGNKVLNDMLCDGDVVLFENDLPDNYN
ncbi:MAG: UDP-N-acetylmuramoyl-tripeptide--D-alanyl-D-alanine ligase [Clostridiales bacterium]|nr:UDP-N-acetylmuramoyl-tripeptide--D-alanyl-D-alanine ligase [Clostridiales bacterium]